MRLQAWNFVIMHLTAWTLIVQGRALTWISSDATLLGVVATCFSVLIAVCTFGFLVRFIQNALSRKTAMTLRQSLFNSATYSVVILLLFYGTLIFSFNWPYNTVRVIPEEFQNSEVTAWLGLALTLLSPVLWLAGLLMAIFGVKTNKGWRLEYPGVHSTKSE